MTATSERTERHRRPRHRFALLAGVCVLALATCAPSLPAARFAQSLENGAPARLESTSHAVRFDAGIGAAAGVPGRGATGGAVPGDALQPAPAFSPVTVQRPTIRLSGAGSASDPVAAALGVEGVTFATSVVLGTLAIAPGDEPRAVEVVAVDPEGFRLMVPQVTADAVDVWHRIVEGDAAFTHDLGHELQREHGIELGGRVPLDGGGSVRIGAYASNGAPPVADVVVARARAAELALEDAERVVLVAADTAADPDDVAARLEAATGLDAEVLPAPSVRRALLTGAASRAAFEPFTYVSLGDGMIQMNRDWVRRNIVSADVPVFRGHVTCHRLMIPQLRGALQEIVDRGLDHLIDPAQYGGCWVPRHILFDPDRSLSMHAWGLAIDFNVPANQYGARPRMDRRIVEVFERWGFAWGGRWSTPDGMHFELSALMEDANR